MDELKSRTKELKADKKRLEELLSMKEKQIEQL